MKPSEIINKIKILQNTGKQNLSPGNLIVEIGKSFLGAPYQAGSLETGEREKLKINLAAFDCLTFVETVVAAARCVREEKLTPRQLGKKIKFIRYRQGKIAGYASRLHYYTDWLRDNEKKNTLKDVTPLLGGSQILKEINFMTTQRHLYPALKNPKTFARIKNIENALSSQTFRQIDKNNVSAILSVICQGDLIAFTTQEKGLDVAHAGFALWRGKNLHLLHASRKAGAVVISPETLLAYLQANQQWNGILVARLASVNHPDNRQI